MKTDRKDILLRAAYDLLTVANRANYVKETCSILTYYDDAVCDGTCLLDDIAHELGINTGTDPIPLPEGESND